MVSQLPKHAHAKLSTFTSQGLANTCWALATLGVGSAEDLTPFAREIEARADEFKPQVRLYPLVMFITYVGIVKCHVGLSDSAILKFLLSSLIGRAGGRRRPVAAARGAVLVLSRRGAARELCKFWKVYVACARRVDGVKGLWEISEGATVRCHRTRNARASQIDRRPRGVLTVVGRALDAGIRVATRQLSASIISIARVVPAR